MDEFSFPAISTDQDSPCQLPFPLWFLHHRRSFSSEGAAEDGDTPNSPALSDEDGSCNRVHASEEKMDMLWEDFNEELSRATHEMKGKAGSLAELRALGMSKGSGSLFHHGRVSLMMLLKVLKKLFLIQKTSSTKQPSLCRSIIQPTGAN